MSSMKKNCLCHSSFFLRWGNIHMYEIFSACKGRKKLFAANLNSHVYRSNVVHMVFFCCGYIVFEGLGGFLKIFFKCASIHMMMKCDDVNLKYMGQNNIKTRSLCTILELFCTFTVIFLFRNLICQTYGSHRFITVLFVIHMVYGPWIFQGTTSLSYRICALYWKKLDVCMHNTIRFIQFLLVISMILSIYERCFCPQII